MEILNDGSVKGKTFSGKDYKGGYPNENLDKNRNGICLYF